MYTSYLWFKTFLLLVSDGFSLAMLYFAHFVAVDDFTDSDDESMTSSRVSLNDSKRTKSVSSTK